MDETTASESKQAAPSPEVPEKPVRRRFTAEYKLLYLLPKHLELPQSTPNTSLYSLTTYKHARQDSNLQPAD